MRRFLEGSRAIAETVARCRPAVVPAYPITPQTHIVEALGVLIKDGELAGSQFIPADSEFAAGLVPARTAARHRTPGAGGRRRALRAVGCLPPPAARACRGDPRRRSRARRHDALRHSGIPAFRLPRDVLDAELDRLLSLGISVRLGRRTTDLAAELAEGGFDAAFVAVGAQLSRRAYIPAGQSARVLDALSLLAGVEQGERPRLGRRVVVYGGGNTAMDAARTARRLGADEALVVYRRTREMMPANDIEVAEALGEGVQLRWLSTITHIDGGRLTLERMRLDENGKPQPTGQFEDIEGDALVLALGQEVDHGLLDGLAGVVVREDGVVEVDRNMMTGRPGVFAGGDMVPATRSVAVAVGHGHTAADAIDAWLRGTERSEPAVAETASFDLLNPWYYSEAPRSIQPKLQAARQVADFAEVVGGLDADTALFEARRCLSCGNCFGCDNCYGLCPDNAVIKTDEGHGYAIDLDYCKGCGICAAECPAGAITMRPEGADPSSRDLRLRTCGRKGNRMGAHRRKPA